MFASTENKGFQIGFQNGWTISVQFGYGNYCDNGHHPDGWNFAEKQPITTSSDAEIAIWSTVNGWYTFENGGMVLGYQTPDQVAEWIDKVSKF